MFVDLKKTAFKKLAFASLFMVLFIDGLGISIILPLFSDLFLDIQKSILLPTASKQIRSFIYGLSLMSFSVAMFFGAPLLGELSDKFGRKKILLCSLLGTLIGYLFSGLGIYLKSPTLFVLGRILDGITAGSIPIAQAIIADITPDNKKVGNFGLILFAVTSGYMVGPLISAFLSKNEYYEGFGLHTPFYATASLCFFGLLFLLPLQETRVLDTNQPINFLSSLRFFSLLPKIKNASAILIGFLFFQLGWSLYFQYIPYFLSSTIHSEIIPHILSLLGFGMALSFCFLTRFLQGKFTALQLALMSSLIIAISITSQIFWEKVSIVLIISTLFGSLAYGLGYSALIAFLSQNMNKTLQGLLMGVAASISALSAATTALLGSIIVNISHCSTLIFASLSFITCFFILLRLYYLNLPLTQQEMVK